MSEFFPSTAIVDKQRYPDIEEIISSAEKNGFSFLKIEIISEGEEVELGNKFLELLEKKGYSMLHLISDEDYQIGLNRVKSEMKNCPIKRKSAGGTLVWLIKNEKM